MEKLIFEKNERAISRGNHVTDVDAEYCVKCGIDLVHPNFSGMCASFQGTACPHTRIEYTPTLVIAEKKREWKIGDMVQTISSDGTMGPGEIISFHHGHKHGTIAIVHYLKYSDRDRPCYRQEWYDTLIAWEEPEMRAASSICALTFQALRCANRARMPLFKNATGETKHSGQDWTVSDWALATAGETGELAEVLLKFALMVMSLGKAENIMKKMRRHDFDVLAGKDEVAGELADVQIYLDMLADSLGIDLGEAVIDKWNWKSDQLDIPLRLSETKVERTDIEQL